MNKKHNLNDKMKQLVCGGSDWCMCMVSSSGSGFKSIGGEKSNLIDCNTWCCEENKGLKYAFAGSRSYTECSLLAEINDFFITIPGSYVSDGVTSLSSLDDELKSDQCLTDFVDYLYSQQ